MPTNTVLSRVQESEFFSIMIPGVHMLVVIGAVLHVVSGKPPDALWDSVEFVTGNWPVAILLLFGAYLLGSIARAIPVDIMDNMIARFMRGSLMCGLGMRARKHRERYNARFPFRRTVLKRIYRELRQNGMCSGVDVPRASKSHTVFNLWKMYLCEAAPNRFAYTQRIEARTRLFCGMIAAGGFGGLLLLLVLSGSIVMSGWEAVYVTYVTYGNDWVWVKWLGPVGLVLLIVPLNAGLRVRNVLRGLVLLLVVCGPMFLTGWAVVLQPMIASGWVGPIGFLLLVSVMIVIPFGRQLRWVRRGEVEHVFLAYIATVASKGPASDPTRGRRHRRRFWR